MNDTVKARVRVVCTSCDHAVFWAIPQGMGADRFLAPIPCDNCKRRTLRADVPEPPPTQPEIPGLR